MLTAEEVQELYEKVTDEVYHHQTYHNWYSYGNDDWKDDGRYVSFEVYGWSDQGEGAEWTEYWAIDSDGNICTEDGIYKTFEEFYSDWS